MLVSYVTPARGEYVREECADKVTGDETRQIPDFHSEMEARLRMNW